MFVLIRPSGAREAAQQQQKRKATGTSGARAGFGVSLWGSVLGMALKGSFLTQCSFLDFVACQHHLLKPFVSNHHVVCSPNS